MKKRHPVYRKRGASNQYFMVLSLLAAALAISLVMAMTVSIEHPAKVWFDTKAPDNRLNTTPKTAPEATTKP